MAPDITKVKKKAFAEDLTNYPIEIPYDCFFQCFARTGTPNGTPIIRIAINSIFIYEGYGVTGQYKYLWSPMFRVKKGDVISLTLQTGTTEDVTRGEKAYQFFPFR